MSNSNKITVKKVVIESNQEGQRLDNFLRKMLPGVPTSLIYKIIRDGQVRVNSGRVKPLYKIKYKDIVRIKSNRNTLFICYEKLCNEEEYWSDILENVEIRHKYEYTFKESKKNIDINVNQELLDMAESTYHELVNKN